MTFDFANWAMMFGLAGLGLPVLAHLLSKRKFDVVQWGAMQFLELGRNTRRKIRLEELLLMLLRMGLLALLVFGFARPWASGRMLARFVSPHSRDVVFIIDGSYSMGWEGKTVTPSAAAVQWVHHFLEELRPGDTVALLEARDQVRPVVVPPTGDFGLVRKSLNELPPPTGTSDLAEAVAAAVRILTASSNLSREIIVLTDLQARSWSASDKTRWDLLDDLRKQSTVPARTWVVDVSPQASAVRTNFSLDRLQLSRELTAPHLPVRIKTKLHYYGGPSAAARKVYLEADGQRLAEATLQTPLLQPGGEFSIEFEQRFTAPGPHLVSVVLDSDNLPGDNRSDAVVQVAASLRVLLVDGDPQRDPTRSETFFAKAALTASENETPLIRAAVIPPEKLTAQTLGEALVVVLANVPRLTPEQAAALQTYVAGGGGLLVAAGDKVHAGIYNQLLFDAGRGPLPAALGALEKEIPDAPLGVHVASQSLDLPFITQFRADQEGGFTDARFTHWWKVNVPAGAPDNPEARPAPAPAPSGELPQEPELAPAVGPAIVAARFSTGDPYLVTRDYGRGRALLMTAPLDADWSTLPTKQDYVPLLHELIFHLARGLASSRNVSVGEPLVLPVEPGFEEGKFVFRLPGGKDVAPVVTGDELHPLAQCNDTLLPGIYSLLPERQAKLPPGPFRGEPFVVNSDRAESDLTPLSDAERETLAEGGRLQFLKTQEELVQGMFSNDSRAEFWQLLLLLVLGLLVAEVWMTMRLAAAAGGNPSAEA